MILSVDCGSTNLKAALYDEGLRLAAAHSVPVIYSRRDAVHAEFEAGPAWDAFSSLIRELLTRARCPLSAITHVAMGSQAQTFCLLDAAGQPLTPFISWMDIRADAESKALSQRFGSDFHRHCSFVSPSAALQVAKLHWVRSRRPVEWSRTRRLVTVPGFFMLKLAGINPIDTNHAAMNGLYSQETGTWREDLLRYCGIRQEWLPELEPAGSARMGTLRFEGQSVGGVKFVLAGNDHTAGALGNGCRPGEVIVTFGTALVAYRRSGEGPGPYNAGGCWGPYPLGGYYELAASNYGCSALDWAREELMPGKPASEFDALAASIPPNPGRVRFYPEKARTAEAWSGEGTPAERARAVLEGILMSLRSLLTEGMGVKDPPGVCALGGGSKSGIWMQMAADVLGCPVRKGGGDSLLGAAALAAGKAHELESRPGDEWKPVNRINRGC